MVPIGYIRRSALYWAAKPYKLIAKATLACLGVPQPPAAPERRPGGRVLAAEAEVEELMAETSSPMDGRRG